MTKNEFMEQLRGKLSRLPEQDIEDRLNFYGEMIDDRVEDGLSEEDAVAEIAFRMESELASEIHFETADPPKNEKKRHVRGWEIALLAVGFPIWGSLVIAAVAVAVSLYAVLWSLVVSVWAVFVSFAACALAFVAVAPVLAVVGKGLAGLLLVGSGMILAGLAIFVFFGSKALSKGAWYLSALPVIGFKKAFSKEERS